MKKNEQIKIAVFVSGGGTNLQALIDAQGSGVIRHGAIRLVVSNNEGAYALRRAEKAGIESVVLSKKDYPTQDAFEEKLIVIVGGYDKHIPIEPLSANQFDLTRIYCAAFQSSSRYKY